jgi:hypothetical protein
MTATSKPTVTLDSIYDAMFKAYREAITTGRNWHAVTVGVDGEPYLRMEVSRCYSELEYFGGEPTTPLTVWSMQGDSSVSEDEIDAYVDAFEPAEQFAGYGGVSELVRKLEEAGFTVEV